MSGPILTGDTVGGNFSGGDLPPLNLVSQSGEFDGNERIPNFRYLTPDGKVHFADIVISRLYGTLSGDVESKYAVVWLEDTGDRQTGPKKVGGNSPEYELIRILKQIASQSDVLKVQTLEKFSNMLRPPTLKVLQESLAFVVGVKKPIFDPLEEFTFQIEKIPRSKPEKADIAGNPRLAACREYTLPEYRELLWDSSGQIVSILERAGLFPENSTDMQKDLGARLRSRINNYFAPNWTDFQGFCHSLNKAHEMHAADPWILTNEKLMPWAEAITSDILHEFFEQCKISEKDPESILLLPPEDIARDTVKLYEAKQQICAMILFYLPESWLLKLDAIQSKKFYSLME